MTSALQPPRSSRLDPLEAGDVRVLLANVRRLERVARAMPLTGVLRGKNLGLLCETEGGDDAIRFRDAAEGLGARVAHIQPSLSTLSSPHLLQDTARTLGKLYDAVECQGLSADLVRKIGDEAGVPVYDGIASASHPTAGLVDLLGAQRPPTDHRRLILQAALMSTLL